MKIFTNQPQPRPPPQLKNNRMKLPICLASCVLEIAYDYEPSLFNRYDEEYRTPLSNAASIGYLDGVRFIVEKFADPTYWRDPFGWCCPIHMAAMKGHVEIVREFLERFPDLREILNGSGQNILHMAAESGRAKVVSYILQLPELEMLINETDEGGNTPLHLATVMAHPKVVSILTWDKRVRFDLKDDKGHTVMDAALMSFNRNSPSFQQRLTWLALKHANAPRGKDIPTTQTPRRGTGEYRMLYVARRPNLDAYKDMTTSFMLTATLIMTVTFAAGLAVPGGFSTDSNPKGVAVLGKKASFQAFVITNTMAFYSSMLVVLALVWAQMGDLYLIKSFLKLAVPLLGLSLTTVSLSFMMGVSLVVSNLSWLPCVVLLVSSIFLFSGLTLLLLPSLPASLNHQALRYIVYYPFCLLIFIAELNPQGDVEPDYDSDSDEYSEDKESDEKEPDDKESNKKEPDDKEYDQKEPDDEQEPDDEESYDENGIVGLDDVKHDHC
ncbi:unnamed protein product [Thlaspi arvense]|uniref:PGG domain-containing protein n=1 Tax=Thlaspi arvense TaxID=13288 RepID=A0AAU9SNG6_THLAR|nr:unnamed protein product [Thlaspi arvense]